MKELYTSEIMSFAARIPHIGTLPDAQGQGVAHARLCGSKISVWLNISNGQVCDFSQQVKACLVGQASASILGHHIMGATRSEIRQTRETVRVMLEEGGEPPVGKWADFALLVPVRNYKSRYSTVLIAFDAVLEAMELALDSKKDENV
ncbi:MAG: iron-sulfur cluster assembly scaffold protein [Hyphomicrobiaceae bacterium]|nr:iron-sulfur cluster assembly scaffold protein [Hyphomicrobiaceae bacterium]